MKIVFRDYRHGIVKVQAENNDDIWCLSHIIEQNDKVAGKTYRKIKLGNESSRSESVKKAIYLEIDVNKVDFSQDGNALRVSGKVIEGPEDVPKGSHHTFEISKGTVIKIIKSQWFKYQIDWIEEGAKEKPLGILVCVLDRDSIGFALLKKYGYEWLSEYKGNVEKKQYKTKNQGQTFYAEAAKILADYVNRYKIEQIILGSPAFWKDDFFKFLENKYPLIANIITLATCNYTGREGINEILKRNEVKTVLQKQRVSREILLVDELMKQIAKNGTAAYGFNEVKSVAEMGAVKVLLITDALVQKYRSENQFEQLDNIMKTVDKADGEIMIISSEHEGGEKLNGLGGIGALLRYKVF